MKKYNAGEKEFDEMAEAIGKYIAAMGGMAVVVGGVSVGNESGEMNFNHFIKIRFTGRLPTKRNL